MLVWVSFHIISMKQRFLLSFFPSFFLLPRNTTPNGSWIISPSLYSLILIFPFNKAFITFSFLLKVTDRSISVKDKWAKCVSNKALICPCPMMYVALFGFWVLFKSLFSFAIMIRSFTFVRGIYAMVKSNSILFSLTTLCWTFATHIQTKHLELSTQAWLPSPRTVLLPHSS